MKGSDEIGLAAGESPTASARLDPVGNPTRETAGRKVAGATTLLTPRRQCEFCSTLPLRSHCTPNSHKGLGSFSAAMAGDDTDASTSSSGATERLQQISSHIEPSVQVQKKRRRRRADSDLPADYSDILGQVAALRKIAATPDPNNRGYVRQKQAGKMWVRERVDQLLDPGSFQEVGSVSGTVKWKHLGGIKEEPEEYVPSNNVQGFGKLKGRKIVFTADDFSIRAGHADGALMEKTVRNPAISNIAG